MKVLITGSAGFVGRNLAKACRARRDSVVEMDTEFDADCLPFFLGDLRHHFDLVLHCAAFVQGRSGIDGAPSHLHTYNTMLDAAMFNWALKARPGRVVYFSSSAAYPVAMQVNGEWEGSCRPLREDDINLNFTWAPEASYGRVKLHGEQMAADVRAADVPVTVLRPFSGYGSDQALVYPFPSFIARAKARQDPFEIWGSGSQVRDWIHIDDIVAATLKAVDEGIDGPVNLCTGRDMTFGRLADMVTKISGYQPPFRCLPEKPGGVDYRVGDPTRLHEFYRPQVGLEEGIQRALMT